MIEFKKTIEPIDYPIALNFMEERVMQIALGEKPQLIWFLEHNSLYTAGTSSEKKDLINQYSFPVYEAGRGGKYTYHGLGQRIVYVMMDIKKQGGDVHKFINNLEEWIIKTIATFGIKGEKRKDRVGIWVVMPDNSEEKIAAIGIRIRKGISFHGIAINLNPNLEHFSGIIPCGLANFKVTSLHKLGIKITMNELDCALIKTFREVFNQDLKHLL